MKPQVAFFEALGGPGLTALERVCAHARDADLLVIADAKRGDIGSTAEAYAQAWIYRRDGGPPVADAITVSPYLGGDSLEPFFAADTTAPESSSSPTRRIRAAPTSRRRSWPTAAPCGSAPPSSSPAGVRPSSASRASRPSARSSARPGPRPSPGPATSCRTSRCSCRASAPRAARRATCQAAFRDHPAGGLIVAARSVIYAWRERGGDWQQGVRTAAADLRRAAVPA